MAKVIGIVCTRSDKQPTYYPYLQRHFPEGFYPQVDEKSIFEGYTKGIAQAVEKSQLVDDDILAFCHDDIEIITKHEMFYSILNYALVKFPEAGFVGVAGTRKLGEDCVWWNQMHWQQGFHRGSIYHGKDILSAHHTVYTPPNAGKDHDREVLVLDGVFLACKLSTINKIGGWVKPDDFPGTWDFYDVYTTWKARRFGFRNYVVPITVLHNSSGELVGREGWEANRKEFQSLISTPVELV